ncbi:DinB family protein [Hymenobacter psychrophilus]|uniref:DinB superfamily protein n=1 Tax=Hymenobacter psychrophilus TaxID=651662 RepID=A0A1H3JJY7_9BACT|nr:DinB family protein [Hymenobacter psychrophilus]SDY40290.1 DinB superfamily protein [Hymenobacter psychrophilus]
MDQTTKKGIVTELISLLTQGNAHVTFEDACADLTPAQWNQHAPEAPYTIWQLADHIRIAQWDIVEFSLGAEHTSPEWPAGYWPAQTATADEAQWYQTLAQIQADRQRFIDLLQHPTTDLLAPLPHGDGQTILREALLIGDHTAYHTGEIILIRRLLHAW